MNIQDLKMNIQDSINRQTRIYYINERTTKVYDIDNLPINDTVRTYIERVFFKISYNRVKEIEKAFFIRTLFKLGDKYNDCTNHSFNYYLEKFREQTEAKDEQIKGFIRYFNDNKPSLKSLSYTNATMKKIKAVACSWLEKDYLKGWYSSRLSWYGSIDLFQAEKDKALNAISNHIILNYGDENYNRLKNTIINKEKMVLNDENVARLIEINALN